MSSHTFDAIVMAMVLVSLLSLAIGLIVQSIRARRNERQVAGDLMLSRGLLSAKRSGFITRAPR